MTWAKPPTLKFTLTVGDTKMRSSALDSDSSVVETTSVATQEFVIGLTAKSVRTEDGVAFTNTLFSNEYTKTPEGHNSGVVNIVNGDTDVVIVPSCTSVEVVSDKEVVFTLDDGTTQTVLPASKRLAYDGSGRHRVLVTYPAVTGMETEVAALTFLAVSE